MENKGHRIVGIKAIADYLNTSERSIYRWEKEQGLPLRRVSGTRGSSVFVYVGELEHWLKTKDAAQKRQRSFRKRAWITIAVLSFIIVSFAVFFVVTTPMNNKGDISPYPVTSSISGNRVYIKNDTGEDIWSCLTYNSPIDPVKWSRNKSIDFFDIDKDGANEVVSPVYDPVNEKFSLTLFDNDGSTLWQKSISNEQTFDGLLLRFNFLPRISRFANSNDKKTFIVTFWRHKTRFLSLISRHTCQGHLLHKYIHIGHLRTLKIHDLDNDENDEILFGGTNNLLNGEGVLGVLNLEDFRGVSPPYRVEPEYEHLEFRLGIYVPDNPEKGNQRDYLRFKKIDRFQPYQKTHVFGHIHDIGSASVHVQLFPWRFNIQDQSCGFEYVFTKKFNLKYVFPDSHMLQFYPQIFEAAKEKWPMHDIVALFSNNVFRWENSEWVPVTPKRVHFVE